MNIETVVVKSENYYAEFDRISTEQMAMGNPVVIIEVPAAIAVYLCNRFLVVSNKFSSLFRIQDRLILTDNSLLSPTWGLSGSPSGVRFVSCRYMGLHSDDDHDSILQQLEAAVIHHNTEKITPFSPKFLLHVYNGSGLDMVAVMIGERHWEIMDLYECNSYNECLENRDMFNRFLPEHMQPATIIKVEVLYEIVIYE